MPPPEDDILDTRLEEAANADPQRDSWMQAPSLDVDYVQRRKKEKSTYIRATQADHQMKMHQAEPKHHLPAQRQANYTFGDAGSQWHMTKLKAVYKTIEETGRSVEDVVLERYGDLLDFDDARDEIEFDRRKMYGKDYVSKEKPSGELYQQRKLVRGIKRPSKEDKEVDLPQG